MQAPIARAALALAICLTSSAAAQQSPLGYAIDVTDRADDQFKVTAWVSGLTAENAVYQFAATAPGTYQVMDIGRFVRGFEAFDAAGALDRLEAFASHFGADFYGLPRNTGSVTLRREAWTPPARMPFGASGSDAEIVPFRADETIAWRCT